MPGTEKSHLIRQIPLLAIESEIQAFLIDRLARGLSESTIRFYRYELGIWRKWAAGHGIGAVPHITPTSLRRWLLNLGETRNPGGVHASYRALKAFLNWVWEEHELETRNPVRRVSAPKVPDKTLEPLSTTILDAMLKTCATRGFTDVRDRALLLALLDTGCRASEFVALDLGDVDLNTGTVLVRRGKGGRARVTFMGKVTRREVSRYLRNHGTRSSDAPLWVTQYGGRLRYAGLRSIVRRRAEAAGVAVPSLHSFRRAFAIMSLRNGADIYSLQRLMGHSDLTVLRRYLKQTDEDLRDAHRRTGPVDNL
jgi:site-specific recombinase XerD